MDRRVIPLALSLIALLAVAGGLLLRGEDEAPPEEEAPPLTLRIGFTPVSQQLLLYKALANRVERKRLDPDAVELLLSTTEGLVPTALSKEAMSALKGGDLHPSRQAALDGLLAGELDCAVLSAVQVLEETAAGRLNPMVVAQLGQAEEGGSGLQLVLREGVEPPADLSGARAAAGSLPGQLLLSRLAGRRVPYREHLHTALAEGSVDVGLGGGRELTALIQSGGARVWRELTQEEREVSVDLLACHFEALRETSRLATLADVARGYRSYLQRKMDEESLVYRFSYSPSGRVESERLQAMADEMASFGMLKRAPLIFEIQPTAGGAELEELRNRADVVKVDNSLLTGGMKDPGKAKVEHPEESGKEKSGKEKSGKEKSGKGKKGKGGD